MRGIADCPRGPQVTARPANEANGAMTALVGAALLAAHPGVEDRFALGRSVVVEEDQQGVVAQVLRGHPLVETRQIVIDVLDQAEEARNLEVFDRIPVWSEVPREGMKRVVRRIQRDVCEERLAGIGLLAHPVHGAVEPLIGAEAIRVAGLLLIEVARVVQVVVVLDLGGEAPALVPHSALEPAVQGTVRECVTEMPLAEETCRVPVLGEDLGHGSNVPSHEVAAGGHHPRLVAQRVEAGHQFAPRRRAYGSDVKVREADALVVEPIHVGCLEDRIAVSRHVTVPLVVRQDDDDVRPR